VRRHRFDPFSLLFGAVFAGIGLSYLMGSTIADTSRIVWPTVSLIVGGTIVAWGVTSILRQRRLDAPVPEPESASDVEEPPEARASRGRPPPIGA
jgi:hypothetical protein